MIAAELQMIALLLDHFIVRSLLFFRFFLHICKKNSNFAGQTKNLVFYEKAFYISFGPLVNYHDLGRGVHSRQLDLQNNFRYRGGTSKGWEIFNCSSSQSYCYLPRSKIYGNKYWTVCVQWYLLSDLCVHP